MTSKQLAIGLGGTFLVAGTVLVRCADIETRRQAVEAGSPHRYPLRPGLITEFMRVADGTTSIQDRPDLMMAAMVLLFAAAVGAWVFFNR